jgi:hypothetical protein
VAVHILVDVNGSERNYRISSKGDLLLSAPGLLFPNTSASSIKFVLFLLLFLVGLGFKLGLGQTLYPLRHTSSPFCSGYFGDGWF